MNSRWKGFNIVMEIKGQILEIIYRNDSNSYTIAEFEKEDTEALTIVRVSSIYRRRRYLKINSEKW